MANVANITSSNPGRAGVFYRAPLGATVPTSAIDQLDALYEDQGIVGEDGVAQAITRDTEDVKAYGGDTVYTLQTDYGQEFTVTVYESTNVPTLKTVFGDDNVTVDDEGNITVLHNKSRLPRSTVVFDHLIDQGVKRQVAEQAQVVSVGDIVNVHTDIVKYELTIKLYPDVNGNVLVEYYGIDGAEPLQVATQVLTAGIQGQEYNAKLVAVGGTAPYSFASDDLPTGLSLATDGTLSGTPTVTGAQSFTVTVTDGDGKSAQATLTVQINPDPAGD